MSDPRLDSRAGEAAPVSGRPILRFFVNSAQDMAELLKVTFLSLYGEDKGTTHTVHPHTETEPTPSHLMYIPMTLPDQSIQAKPVIWTAVAN